MVKSAIARCEYVPRFDRYQASLSAVTFPRQFFYPNIPWHLGLAMRLVRPACRAHVMVPFAELEGRSKY
jgi:hypothetical protein